MRQDLKQSILISLLLAGWIAGDGRLATPKETNQSGHANSSTDCASLDDTLKRGLMSAALERKLLLACGRESELGNVPSTPPRAPFDLGTDVLVNDPTGDSGSSRAQSETSLAQNGDGSVICSAYNDSYHYYGEGKGFTGFSSSTTSAASWVDRGAVYDATGETPWGDPSNVWSKRDGVFYHASLSDTGLGLWNLGANCASSTWIGIIHSSPNDDKEMMAVDNNPLSPYYGRLYVGWIDFNDGDIYSTYSDNGGSSWSTPLDISGHWNVQGAWPAVDPVTNDIYMGWVHWDTYPAGPIDIEIVRSTNGGDTYSYVTNPANNVTNARDATASSSCARPALNGNIRLLPAPQIATDINSNLHAVYVYDPDGYGTGDVVNVYYRRSTNQGTTWETEIKLNDDATTNDQWFPALTVNPSGIVGTFWYDRRLDGGNLLFDYYKAVSLDNGVSFEANERVTSSSSPVVLDPGTSACYHGDYDTSISDESTFYIQWSDDRGGTQDVYSDTAPIPNFKETSIGVFRPSIAKFLLRNSNSAGSPDYSFAFGSSSDKPITGDWDGDNDMTIGVYRPSNKTFYLRNSNSGGAADLSFIFGGSGDLPITGDWDGDDDTTIGVYRSSNKIFYLRNSNSGGASDLSFTFGSTGDLPVTGDWDGDGDTTIGVYRPSNKTFYLKNSNSGGAADISFTFGNSGDLPVSGDWDSDGDITVGLFRPSNSTFYLKNENTGGAADISFTYGSGTDLPVSGDWDGN